MEPTKTQPTAVIELHLPSKRGSGTWSGRVSKKVNPLNGIEEDYVNIAFTIPKSVRDTLDNQGELDRSFVAQVALQAGLPAAIVAIKKKLGVQN
jgi:hypothetical protein